jgi:hypothetical protein
MQRSRGSSRSAGLLAVRQHQPQRPAAATPIPPPPQFKPPPLPDEDEDGCFIRPITRTRSPLPPSSSGTLSPVAEVDTPDTSRSVSPNPVSLSEAAAGDMWRQTGVSPQPYIVSHDTFIKGQNGSVVAATAPRPQLRPVSPAVLETAKEPVKAAVMAKPALSSTTVTPPPAAAAAGATAVKRPLRDSPMKPERSGPPPPTMQVEPPTPPVGRLTPSAVTSQQQKKAQPSKPDVVSGAGKADNNNDEPKSKAARLETHQTEQELNKTPSETATGDKNKEQMDTEEDETRFPIQEERLPTKFRRRPSKKIQPRRENSDLDSGVAGKTPAALQEESKDVEEHIGDLSSAERQVVEREDLTEKERSVITEVLLARRSRSRSNSRMSVSPAPPVEEPEAVQQVESAVHQQSFDAKTTENQRLDKLADDAGHEGPAEKVAVQQLAAPTLRDSHPESLPGETDNLTKGTSGIFTESISGTGINKQGENADSCDREDGTAVISSGGGTSAGQPCLADKQVSGQSAGDKAYPSSFESIEEDNLKGRRGRQQGDISLESLLPINVEHIADLTLDQVKEHLFKQVEADLHGGEEGLSQITEEDESMDQGETERGRPHGDVLYSDQKAKLDETLPDVNIDGSRTTNDKKVTGAASGEKKAAPGAKIATETPTGANPDDTRPIGAKTAKSKIAKTITPEKTAGAADTIAETGPRQSAEKSSLQIRPEMWAENSANNAGDTEANSPPSKVSRKPKSPATQNLREAPAAAELQNLPASPAAADVKNLPEAPAATELRDAPAAADLRDSTAAVNLRSLRDAPAAVDLQTLRDAPAAAISAAVDIPVVAPSRRQHATGRNVCCVML